MGGLERVASLAGSLLRFETPITNVMKDSVVDTHFCNFSL